MNGLGKQYRKNQIQKVEKNSKNLRQNAAWEQKSTSVLTLI